MLVALRGMDPSALQHAGAACARARGQLRAALRHVRATPGLWIPLAMMALVGTLVVQLPGAAAAAGQPDVARDGADLRAAHRGDGRRLGGRRARQRRPRARPAAAAGRRRDRFGALELCRGGAVAAAAGPRARPARRHVRDLRRGRQLDAAARGRAGHARARDGALLGRLPRLDADRRAAGRLARRGRRPARRAGARRVRRAGRGRAGGASPTRALGEHRVATAAVAA